MQRYPEVKHFVQEILGCSCPEEVLKRIDCQKEIDCFPERRVNVGDRLLIYMITMDGKPDVQEVVHSALEQGVEERDKKGFNRFRLVLVAARPDDLRSSAERAFNSSGYTDEKTHLHVVNESDVVSF